MFRYPRGFVLGGTSAISKLSSEPSLSSRVLKIWQDYMVYTRGSADDYNRYAKVTGDDGWSWNQMLPYFHKVGMFCYFETPRVLSCSRANVLWKLAKVIIPLGTSTRPTSRQRVSTVLCSPHLPVRWTRKSCMPGEMKTANLNFRRT